MKSTRSIVHPHLLVLPVLSLLPSVLHAQEETPSSSLSLWGMIEQGGWAMYPLGLCSLVMFFLIFYAWRETQKQKFLPAGIEPECLRLLGEFQIEEARQLLKQHDTVLSRSMDKALQRIRVEAPAVNKPKAEATLVEQLESEENAVAQWVNYLNVVGAVAPDDRTSWNGERDDQCLPNDRARRHGPARTACQ
jgi:biopolymer transport protein ExbB